MSQKPRLLRRINHWRIRKTRELRNVCQLTWYHWAYERKRQRLPLSELSSCRTVGIMMLATGIGDAIVMSGLISALRQAGREVHCICSPKSAGILAGMIENDGVHIIPERPKRSDVLKLGLKLDVVLFCGDPDKNIFRDIRVLTAIEHRFAVGFNQPDLRFFDLSIKRDEVGCHWMERLRDAAAHLGVTIDDYRYDLHFSQECQQTVDRWVQAQAPQGLVLFNPVASDKFRTLSPEFIRSTLDYLTAHSTKRLVVFNVTDTSLQQAYPQVIFSPFAQLERCLALVGRCDLLISVDTSFVHAARFFNVPLIGIYNNRLSFNRYDNNVQWGPGYAQAVQVFSLDHDHTETGDDLRKLPFAVLETALDQCAALK